MYPQYENLNLNNYDTLFGYYTLGFIQHHRPDLFIIDVKLKNRSWDNEHVLDDYDWLEIKIQQGLGQGRSVAIIAEDEHVVFLTNTRLTKILNNYVDSPVYWITMLDHAAQASYRETHQFRIKMLELPWVLLNDCLTYYRVANTATNFEPNNNNHNFFCLIGNTAFEHKVNLARELHKKHLSSYGLITVNSNWSFPEDLLEFCQVNQEVVYDPLTNPDYPMIARQVNINGVWVSKNVENYLHIDQKYHHIPLAINPETVTVNFKSTEKSIWPILLGKLFLIYGRPGTMAWIQRFYDIDITRFANMTYDSIPERFSDSAKKRLSAMIDTNQDLIKNARDIQAQLHPELELARWTLGKNLYKFFVSQLELIP
jgi:hypothetical protein